MQEIVAHIATLKKDIDAARGDDGPGPACLRRHLETKADVDGFLDKLRMELEQATANEERVDICWR